MEIKTAYFVGSFPRLNLCPPADIPEYAFIGRSNVGKSSLINMLTNNQKLAKTSGKPGKTQMINYFIINKEWNLVDLPGFGYAKVSKTSRKKWEQFIRNYLAKRTNLQCVFLLIDSRISPQQNDLDFANWMGEMRIPFVLVFTKAEKEKEGALIRKREAFFKAFLETWSEVPQWFVTSARKKIGREEILNFIENVNKDFVIIE